MEKGLIKKINTERLNSWNDKLTSNMSTPVILIGIGHGKHSGQINLCCTEDVSNEEIKYFLAKTLELLIEKP